MRQTLALAAAAALAGAAIAPTPAEARDRYDHRYERHYDRGYHGDRRRHHDDDDDEAIAAGVLGLALGVALGALAASSDDRPDSDAYCSADYQRCAPPQGYGRQGYYDQGYYGPELEGGPARDPRSAYEQDYGYAPSVAQAAPLAGPGGGCIAQVQQWDPVAGRYVLVNLRRPCGD